MAKSTLLWCFLCEFVRLCGIAIGLVTEHFTGINNGPVTEVSKQSVTGHATNIIAGIGCGMRSTTFLLSSSLLQFLGHTICRLIVIAIAAVGMLAHRHSIR